MQAIIRISTRIRACAPIPRDFGFIAGLEHLGLVYQQKVITTPEEFNETLARVSDSRFPARGCEFFPYLLTAEDEAKLDGVPVPETLVLTTDQEEELVDHAKARIEEIVAEMEAEPVTVPAEPEWTAPDPGTEYTVAVDIVAVPVGGPVAPTETDAVTSDGPSFLLDGKSILFEGERIAYLAGDDKQLRVMADHQELRPQIEAWLETLTPSDDQ